MFNGLTIQQFKKCFPTNESCMQYLVKLKWEQGYKCIKCGLSKNSSITTDKWRGYAPLKKDWKITQTLSNKGEAMKMLHIHIMNLKGWLRGIHHKCSKERLQYYLDEYHFRFNRRGSAKDIFDKLIVKAMSILPKPYAAVRICEQTT